MLNKITLSKLIFIAFLISIFLFKVPNFYFFPIIQNSYLTTQSLARAIIILIFITKIVELFFNNKQIFKVKETKTILILLSVFFFFQSLSVIEAQNMVSFLNRYKDVILGFCAVFVFFLYKTKYKEIITVLMYSVILNAFIQFLILFDKDFFLSLFSPVLYKNYLDLLLANIARGRIYVPTFDEIIIPFLFLPLSISFLKSRLLQTTIFCSIVFFALASNIRSNILILLISFVGSIFAFRKIALKRLLLFAFGIVILGYFVNLLLVSYVGFSFYDRLTFQNQQEDIDTISHRGEQISQAILMANSHLFGVGLGNYYDELSASKIVIAYTESRRLEIRNAREYIHNIFGTITAESGYISLLVFIVILVLFIKQDLVIFKDKIQYKKGFVIAFWALFCWGLFNPPVSGYYQVLFWGIRGLLLR